MTTPERDACEFCLGAKGGVKGNENAMNGVVVCDYCTVLVYKATQTGFYSPGAERYRRRIRRGPEDSHE